MSAHPDNQSERDMLLAYVQSARQAIDELRPVEIRARKLPSAMTEIGMIVETTESAANQIMGAVDAILKAPSDLSPEDYRGLVEGQCMSMMEACAFQDLTGQRSTKVIETLLHLEDRLGRLARLLGEEGGGDAWETQANAAPEGDPLLNGPCMPGEGVDQDEIDRLFANG